MSGLGIMMMDLDEFKRVNDTNNHLVGSFVLSEVGRLLKQDPVLNEKDVPARFGGDEFIFLCESDDINELYEKADQIRKNIEQYLFVKENIFVQVTASFGISWSQPQFRGKAEDLIKLADMMLYKSKFEGRNCVNMMELKYPIDFDSLSNQFLQKAHNARSSFVRLDKLKALKLK